MRIIIAGSRQLNPTVDFIGAAVEAFFDNFNVRPSVILSGRCRGPDQVGELWAKQNNVQVEYYPADWNKYGKAAGPIRNRQMAQSANGLILIWDGISHGSQNMLKLADEFELATLQLVREK